jgi:uncharacterized protein (TIGR00369 family)
MITTTSNPETGLSRETLESVIARTPFAMWIGVAIERYGSGEVQIEVPLKRELTQHHGFCHGAVVGFLADSACAWAAASVAGDVVTSEYKINFTAPAIGDRLTARGSVIQASGRQVICRADIHAIKGENKTLVATALATIVALKTRAATASATGA